MASEWPVVRLGDVAAVRSGFAFKSSDWTNGGVPVVKIANVKDGRLVMDGCSFVRPEVAATAAEFDLIVDDVLIAMTGYIGDVALVRPSDLPAVLNQRVGRFSIRDKRRLEHRFLFYLLRSPKIRSEIQGLGFGSAQPNVSPSLIHDVEVPLPPVAEQRAIAHILGTLDDKIELNRRMNETLEAIARALFKSWFVDFDPVRAKSEGRDPGLPPHLADLFPDSFEDSGLGEIPTGWRLGMLTETVEVNPSRPLRKGEVAPYLDMANMPTRGHSPESVVDRPFGSGMRFRNGDTLVARITPCLENGKTAYVDFLANDQIGWGSTEYMVFRPKPPLPTEYAYCLARSQDFREFAIQSMTGSSGRQRVPAESMSHFFTVTPSSHVAHAFGRIIKPFFAQSSAATAQSRSLVALRDTMLPKLLSGELPVKTALAIALTS